MPVTVIDAVTYYAQTATEAMVEGASFDNQFPMAAIRAVMRYLDKGHTYQTKLTELVVEF